MNVPDEAVTFIEEQYPQLVGLLGLYCGDRLLAEDLAQETLERICRDWRRVRRKDSPAAWSRRVAINLANSYFRRKAAERRATSRLQAQVVEPALEDPVGALAVREAVATLPSRMRTAVILHYYLDMSFSGGC
ncbi:MAG: sigma-70 family RNA polymerase sigma factor [Actinobacteria bacterium]|nr:sigma-70 family RNA polymerase sigma factor [Actinomycetota bacterium]